MLILANSLFSVQKCIERFEATLEKNNWRIDLALPKFKKFLEQHFNGAQLESAYPKLHLIESIRGARDTETFLQIIQTAKDNPAEYIDWEPSDDEITQSFTQNNTDFKYSLFKHDGLKKQPQ